MKSSLNIANLTFRNTKVSLETRLFINNEFTESIKKQTIPVINPANESEICTISGAEAEDVDLAVESAFKAKDEWAHYPLDEKAKLFFNLASALESNLKEFSVLEALDNGKPYFDAEEDIKEVIRCIRYYGGWADKITGSTYGHIGEVSVHTRRVPYGVVGLISPWNYPLLMCAWKLFPALAAGNSTVLKCSEETPLTMLKLCHLIKEVGFPKGVVNVVPGYGHTAGEHLTNHKLVSKVSFTGSSIVGKKVLQASSNSNLKKVHLELGGKSPVVIFNDADLEEAVNGSIEAAFRNTCQNCNAGTRYLVQEGIYDKFVAAFGEATKKLKVSSFEEDGNLIGPVINKRQFDKILNYIEVGKKEGLNLVTGGNRLFDKGYFIEPTVFSNVPDTSRLAVEEIFGPVVVVLTPFKDYDEAIRRAHDTNYGLAAGVFTKNASTAEKFVRDIVAGSVWINTYNITPYNIPFGGMKESGFGRDNGYEAILEYSTTKAVYQKFDFNKI